MIVALSTIEPERVICMGTLPNGRECHQLLAHRYPGGAVRVRVQGDHPPEYLPDGRVVVVCPSCGKRVRIKPKAKAA